MDIVSFQRKDNQLTIRFPVVSDTDHLMLLVDSIMKDGKHYHSNEIGYSKSQYEEFIKNINDGLTIMLIALIENQIVGWAILTRRRYRYKYHIGSLVIGVKEGFRNRGLGKKLVSSIELLAKKNQIERMESFIRKSDANAINFFIHLGFIQDGVSFRSIKSDGGYDDEVIMSKILS